MIRLWKHLVAGIRSLASDPPPARRRRGGQVEVTPLEDRHLLYAVVGGVLVNPSTLWPPNGRFVPVQVAGAIFESHKGEQPTADFQLIDEYRKIDAAGPLTLVPFAPDVYTYRLTLPLQASRAEEYPAGRRYYIVIAARDSDGSTGKVVPVQVPRSLKDRGPGPQVPTPPRP
ncbi:MAG: hypothetical protein IRY99_19285, partial [Isosphaeraceae bacterium]|nr:hypothetical protein [Isosphaeraceae bacterium]